LPVFSWASSPLEDLLVRVKEITTELSALGFGLDEAIKG
jgi:hypothetical protein